MATNPSGRPESSSAPTTPIRPSGTMARTSSVRLKVLSWIISSASVRNTISGSTAITEARELALSSAMPPSAIR